MDSGTCTVATKQQQVKQGIRSRPEEGWPCHPEIARPAQQCYQLPPSIPFLTTAQGRELPFFEPRNPMLHRWTLHPKRSSYDFFVWTDFGPIFPWSVLPLSWIVVDSLCSVFGEADEHGFGPLQRTGDSRDKRKGCKAVVARRGVTGEEIMQLQSG